MTKQQQQRGAKIGKGKVTAVQVAFIVEQYLADNNYANALSAFRSDAADLFAKMKTKKSRSKEKEKEVPKGLLGLGEILDEYISLKEQKLLLQQDKVRVENAMHAFHNLMRAYCQSSGSGSLLPVSTGTPSSPSDLIPPQFVASNHPQCQPQLQPLIMPFLPHTASPLLPAHTPGLFFYFSLLLFSNVNSICCSLLSDFQRCLHEIYSLCLYNLIFFLMEFNRYFDEHFSGHDDSISVPHPNQLFYSHNQLFMSHCLSQQEESLQVCAKCPSCFQETMHSTVISSSINQ